MWKGNQNCLLFSVFQTIALFIYLAGRLNDEGPFLILSPLSVLSNWKEEMERYRVDVVEIFFFYFFFWALCEI